MGSNVAEKLSEVSLDEIMSSPEEYGMPTFDQFRKNPDNYRKRSDHTLEIVERGSQLIGGSIEKYEFWIYGYKCKTLHEVQRIAGNMGIANKDLKMISELIPGVAHKGTMKINFMSKADYKRRSEWA